MKTHHLSKFFLIIVSIVIVYLLLLYCAKFLVLSKYNVYPKRIVREYLDSTFQETFDILNCDYYLKDGHCVWRFRCESSDNYEFYEYYEHPFEYSGMGSCWLFDKERKEQGIYDYYWKNKLMDIYVNKFDFDKYHITLPEHHGAINFEVQTQQDINGIADIMTEIFCYTFTNVDRPSSTVLACTVKYQGKYICGIGIEDNGKIYDYVDAEREEIFQYIYSKISSGWTAYHKRKMIEG